MTGPKAGDAPVDDGRRPAEAGPADRLRALLPFAVQAPSRHNTQPWLFEIEGPEARVYSDPRRALRSADPGGREAILACGAALENLRIAARHAGHAASVEILAARAGGIVGRLRLEEPRPPSADDRALFGAIPLRRTNRFGFDELPLPSGLVARLAREAADLGATLRTVEDGARNAVAVLVADADRAQWKSSRYRAEVAAWTRPPRTKAEDGVPGFARGLGAAAAMLDRLLLNFPGRGEPEGRRDRQHLLHAPTLLVLATRGDAPRDWALAGVALERALLRAAAAGFSASYYSAAIEVAFARARLRELVGERGFPHVLFRLGHGRQVRATPRRGPELVLRAFRPGPSSTTALATRR